MQTHQMLAKRDGWYCQGCGFNKVGRIVHALEVVASFPRQTAEICLRNPACFALSDATVAMPHRYPLRPASTAKIIRMLGSMKTRCCWDHLINESYVRRDKPIYSWSIWRMWCRDPNVISERGKNAIREDQCGASCSLQPRPRTLLAPDSRCLDSEPIGSDIKWFRVAFKVVGAAVKKKFTT